MPGTMPSCLRRLVPPLRGLLLLALLGAPSPCVALALRAPLLAAARPPPPLGAAALTRHRRCSPVVARAEIKQLADETEYDALIEAAKAEDRYVVIKFYASWCRACKAMAPKYQRVTEEWQDNGSGIEFYEILFDNNKKLCKQLGIKILPFMEIVAGSNGKVEGFTCGPSKISRLQDKLERHGCSLVEDIPCTDVADLLPD